MKTKWIKLGLWPVLIAIVWLAAVATTDWLTDGFTTVGPFVG